MPNLKALQDKTVGLCEATTFSSKVTRGIYLILIFVREKAKFLIMNSLIAFSKNI